APRRPQELVLLRAELPLGLQLRIWRRERPEPRRRRRAGRAADGLKSSRGGPVPARRSPERPHPDREPPLVNLRPSLSRGADRVWNATLASVIVGTALAFGGAVWWARPAIAALTFLFVLAGL